MNSNSKILVIGLHSYDIKDSKEYYIGGTEVMNDALLRYLETNDYIVDYLTTTGNRKLPKSYKDHYNLNNSFKININDLEFIRDYISSNKFDLIIVNLCISYSTKSFLNEVLTEFTIPVIVFAHGSNCCNHRYFSTKVLNSPNIHIIMATDHEYTEFLSDGYSTDRLSLIKYPPIINSEPNLETHKLSDGIICNARWTPQKGLENSMKVSYILDCNIGFIGRLGTGSYTKNLLNLVNTNSRYNYIGLLDRNEVYDITKNSAFLVLLPNSSEGISLSILEAMLLGTPVITWNDYSFNTNVPSDMCILLDHNENYLNQLEKEYLPNIDKYLSSDNRNKLYNYAKSKFGVDKFYESLTNIIKSVRGDKM